MEEDKDLVYRMMDFTEGNKPKTINEDNRSVGIVISSDKPIYEYDWRTEEHINTVILPEAIQIPSNGQVPLLDTHSRGSVADILGSVRDISVLGNTLIGVAHYANDEKSKRAFELVKENHLTDYSIGCQLATYEYLEEGESKVFYGRTYTGKMKIVTKAIIKEVSACPIGADENAKNRSQQTNIKEAIMADIIDENKGATVQTVDLEAVKRQVILDERKRMGEIAQICQDLNLDEKFRSEVADLSVSEVKERALKVIAEKNKGQNVSTTPNIQVVKEGIDSFREDVTAGLLFRTNNFDSVKEGSVRTKVARDISGYSMLEICRNLLRLRGQEVSGNPLELVGRAIATGDLSNILGVIANKALLGSFEKKMETYEAWADTSGNLRNFQLHTFARSGEFPALEQQREGESISYGTINDQKETAILYTYAKAIPFTRQAIINDDLRSIDKTLKDMGSAVKAKYADIAYAVLTANANMGDGTALFHSNHANLGTQGVVSETTMNEAFKLMQLQKDIGSSRYLNIQPKFLLSAVKNRGTVEAFFGSKQFLASDTATTRENIWYNSPINRIYDPRLDADDSGDPWYLLAGENTVTMFFLNGNQAPFMEQEKSFDTDAIHFKVRADVGAMAESWKGMVKNTGA